MLEKAEGLGGRITGMYKVPPMSSPHQKLEDSGIQGLIDEVNANTDIEVMVSAEIERANAELE